MDFSKPGIPAIGAAMIGRQEVSSMCYHENGKRLYVASSGDNRLQIIDCLKGESDRPALRCEREQIHVVEATHHEENVLFAGAGNASGGQKHAVHYWSLYDNKILRKFRGHTDRVTSISMCPADDTFLTSSVDRTVRLWTAEKAGCIAEMKLPTNETEGTPITQYDTTGLVFAVSAAMKDKQGHYLHLYDSRNYNAGPFLDVKVKQSDLEMAIQSHVNAQPDRGRELSVGDWTAIYFNVSGNQIMVQADNGMAILLDGFEGTIQRILVSNKNAKGPAACCYSIDDKTVLQGNEDGTISCWNVQTGTIVNTLKGHPGPINCILSNPKYMQIASACKQTALWCW